MTYKFKIGDQVKLLPYPHGDTCEHEGETAVVTKDDSFMPFIKLDKPCTIHEKSECSADRWREEYLKLASRWKKIPKNTVVHVPTQEAYDYLEKIKGECGLRQLSRNYWREVYREETCVRIDQNGCSNKSYYESKGFKVITLNEAIDIYNDVHGKSFDLLRNQRYVISEVNEEKLASNLTETGVITHLECLEEIAGQLHSKLFPHRTNLESSENPDSPEGRSTLTMISDRLITLKDTLEIIEKELNKF